MANVGATAGGPVGGALGGPWPGINVQQNAKITLVGGKDTSNKSDVAKKKGAVRRFWEWLTGKGDDGNKKPSGGFWNKAREWLRKHGPTIVNKPTHKGVDLPGNRNIIHLGKDPRFGKTGHHIGVWHDGPMKAKWHWDF